MKKIQLINFVFLFIALNSIKAQVDTLTDKTIKEQNQLSAKKIKNKQEYLDLNFKEEKTLIKFAISGLTGYYYNDGSPLYINFEGILGFEKKICPSFSFSYENSLHFGFNSKYPFYSISGNAGFRYYYLMKKRIAQSPGGNNFHSNYLAISLDRIYAFNSLVLDPPKKRVNTWKFEPLLYLYWGMQRRIGKWTYFDVSPYIGYNLGDSYSSNFFYGAKLQMGLAWGK